MLSRLAGRVLTGRFAFLLAGAIDICAFGVAALRTSITSRKRA